MFLKDRSTRTVLAALLASAAGILGVNLIIRPEGLADSMGPTFALLLGVAIVLWAWNWRESYLEAHPHVEDADDDGADALPMSTAAPIAAVSVAPVAAAAPAVAAPIEAAPEAELAAPEAELAAPAAAAPVAPVPVEAAPAEPPAPAVTPEPEPPAPVIEQAPPAPAVASPPPAPAKPAKSPKASKAQAVPDDFTKIEGIGKYYNDALHKIGYQSFAALAAETPEAILAKLLGAGYRRHPTIPTWPQQADFAARGDWDGLGKLQATLVSGRKAED